MSATLVAMLLSYAAKAQQPIELERALAPLMAQVPAAPLTAAPATEVALDDPAVMAAKEAIFSKQDYAGALKLLAGLPSALHVRFLRATAAAKLGKTGPASEEFELLALNYPALRDRCAYEAGLLFEQRGLLDKAVKLLTSVDHDAYVLPDANIALARILRMKADYQRASTALEPLLDWPLQKKARSKVLLELSELARLRKDVKAERAALDQLAMLSSWWARQVGYRLGSPAVAMVAKADDMLDHGACTQAEKIARKLQGQPDKLGCSARVIAAEAAACRGDDVTPDLQAIVKDCKQNDLASRALMALGGMQAKHDKALEAIASFRTVAQMSGQSSAGAEASFAAFWVSWKLRGGDAAIDDLLAIEALPSGVIGAQDRARAHFWRARVAQERGAKSEAVALLSEVATVHPATWYARLARMRLFEIDPESASKVTLASVVPLRDEVRGWDVTPELAPGVEALRLGLEGAADELVLLARRNPSFEGNRLAIGVLLAAGEVRPAHRFARAVLREQLGGEKHSAAVWKAAFPTPFAEPIGKFADDESVPRGLLQALVREESAFDPNAKSHVGALGLTQLMPRTAKALARQRGNPLTAMADLFLTDRNLELGAAYLGEMLKRFGGEAALAAAAYNGGPTRVQRWLKLHPADERLEEWVEEIPIDETRNYVKDVLASADVYKGWPVSTQTAQGWLLPTRMSATIVAR